MDTWFTHGVYVAAQAVMAFVKLAAIFAAYYYGSLLLWERLFGHLVKSYKVCAVLALLWLAVAFVCIGWVIATAFSGP